MQRVFRIIKRIFFLLAFLLMLSVPLIGVVSAAFNWHGVCRGFSEAETPCSWWEFARTEMFWAMFLFIPFLFLVSLVYLGMSLAQFIADLVRRRRSRVSAPKM